MDLQTEGFQAVPAPAGAETADRASATTCKVLALLFGPPEERTFAVRYWNGLEEGPSRQVPAFTLVLKHPGALRRMFTPATELNLAESYMRDDFDVLGSLERACLLGDEIGDRLKSARTRARLMALVLALPRGPRVEAATGGPAPGRFLKLPQYVFRHSRRRDAEAVSFAYNSNELHAQFLDEAMVYTCAYYRRPTDTLAEAQRAKLDHVCRKLRLKPGDRLLDLGCGWGALMHHAVEHYGVTAMGVSITPAQIEYCQERFRKAGIADRCRAELLDYRTFTTDQPFDKIACVGMVEHIGIRNLANCYAHVHRLLAPGGLFLNHTITCVLERPSASGRVGTGKVFRQHNPFIQKYIFPDAEMPVLNEVVFAGERVGFEVRDIENLREHYAATLRHWLANLDANADGVRRLIGEAGYRAFRIYLAGFPPRFDQQYMNLVQVLFSKPDATGRTYLPPTRDDIYHDMMESPRR